MVIGAPSPRPGLRERKRAKLRRAVQTEALRLFESQGFDRTTVEQIADAADVSTSTFYRYFPTKEDVVVGDDYDATLEAAFAARPTDEPLAESIRAALAELSATAEVDENFNLARLRLVASVPALAARYAGEERRSAEFLCRLVAERAGRDPDDYQLQVVTAALVAALFTASRRWAHDHAKTPLNVLIDDAIATLEPVLLALHDPARPARKAPRQRAS